MNTPNPMMRWRVALGPHSHEVQATCEPHHTWVLNRMENPQWIFAPNKEAAKRVYRQQYMH